MGLQETVFKRLANPHQCMEPRIRSILLQRRSRFQTGVHRGKFHAHEANSNDANSDHLCVGEFFSPSPGGLPKAVQPVDSHGWKLAQNRRVSVMLSARGSRPLECHARFPAAGGGSLCDDALATR